MEDSESTDAGPSSSSALRVARLNALTRTHASSIASILRHYSRDTVSRLLIEVNANLASLKGGQSDFHVEVDHETIDVFWSDCLPSRRLSGLRFWSLFPHFKQFSLGLVVSSFDRIRTEDDHGPSSSLLSFSTGDDSSIHQTRFWQTFRSFRFRCPLSPPSSSSGPDLASSLRSRLGVPIRDVSRLLRHFSSPSSSIEFNYPHRWVLLPPTSIHCLQSFRRTYDNNEICVPSIPSLLSLFLETFPSFTLLDDLSSYSHFYFHPRLTHTKFPSVSLMSSGSGSGSGRSPSPLIVQLHRSRSGVEVSVSVSICDGCDCEVDRSRCLVFQVSPKTEEGDEFRLIERLGEWEREEEQEEEQEEEEEEEGEEGESVVMCSVCSIKRLRTLARSGELFSTLRKIRDVDSVVSVSSRRVKVEANVISLESPDYSHQCSFCSLEPIVAHTNLFPSASTSNPAPFDSKWCDSCFYEAVLDARIGRNLKKSKTVFMRVALLSSLSLEQDGRERICTELRDELGSREEVATLLFHVITERGKEIQI